MQVIGAIVGVVMFALVIAALCWIAVVFGFIFIMPFVFIKETFRMIVRKR